MFHASPLDLSQPSSSKSTYETTAKGLRSRHKKGRNEEKEDKRVASSGVWSMSGMIDGTARSDMLISATSSVSFMVLQGTKLTEVNGINVSFAYDI